MNGKAVFPIILAFSTLSFLFSGCLTPTPAAAENRELPQPQVQTSVITQTPTVTATFIPTPIPSLTPTRRVSATRTPTPVPTLTQTPSPTSDPFEDYYIDTLAGRNYGGGVIQDEGNLNSAGSFTRKLFKYRSEGLDLYGFINIPRGTGPFPVILMLHGHVTPEDYATLDYSTRYADALTENGFIVVHPNLRGYAPSEGGGNLLGIGDTLDALNLLSLVRSQAGQAGILEKADAGKVGVWGHSMGGGIVLRMLEVDPDIDAAMLYASVSADENLNLNHFDDDGRGNKKLRFPEQALEKISPIYFLERIQAPVSIQHGESDSVVPVEWSRDLCSRLTELGIETECVYYPGQPHTFQNSGDTRLIAQSVAFFSKYLK
ncbi:MAG: alpha/beta fold hydrolase [Anaerolineae bacterium]|nr:alpha/beta fold hydrolase [Anaerolineae bacterium]